MKIVEQMEAAKLETMKVEKKLEEEKKKKVP